jgi:ankyrin repeat-rich membrane spanning protein
MNEEVLEDSTPLKELYDRVRGVMPTQKDLEPLLEMDRDEKKVNENFVIFKIRQCFL